MRSYPERSPHELPALDEVIREFDAQDQRLLMAYDRYLDFPAEKRMNAISAESGELSEALAELLQRVAHDPSGEISPDLAAKILGTLMHKMISDHSRLFAERLDFINPPTDSELEVLREVFQEESELSVDALIDEVTNHFRGELAGDMELIKQYILDDLDSPAYDTARRAVAISKEIAKISIGVAAGIVLADVIRKR